MRQKLFAGALTGLFVGLLAAFAEWLHLALFERGVGFQPLLLLYGDLVDGGIGVLLGLMGGAVWAGWWLSGGAERLLPRGALT